MQENRNHIVSLIELRSLISSTQDTTKLSQHITEYEKFFSLIKKYPNLKAVPTKNIDTVWHFHLEQKELYFKDCLSIFGHVVYHKQATNKKDLFALNASYQLTNKLWHDNYHTFMGDATEQALCGVGDDAGDNDGNDR